MILTDDISVNQEDILVVTPNFYETFGEQKFALAFRIAMHLAS